MEEQKKMIRGGDVLIKCLLEESVTKIFGIIGGQLLTVYDAVYRWGREKGIDTVMFRHEQAAAHAADAWARVTNTPGVCMGTVGPGATHLVPGVGAAWGDNIPMIAIVAQVKTQEADKFALQGGIDQITMFKPITKYQKSVRKVENIPDAVHKAFREATGGRPNPVLLEFYEDALIEEIEEDKVKILTKNQYRAVGKPAVDAQLIKESLDMLLNAKNPLIISGGGVSRAGAWNELQEFAEYLQIPVITTVMGIGTISNQSKCHLGTTMRMFMSMARDADVILNLGCKFSFIMGHGAEPIWNDSQKMIQVDIDPGMIGREKPVTIGIVGDCKSFLTQILDEVKDKQRVEKREWLENLLITKKQMLVALKNMASSDNIPIDPFRMVKEVLEFIDDDAILVIDGGNIVYSTHALLHLYKERKPLSTVHSICMGHLGTSIPYGIGAKLAKPEKQVVSISGDGFFGINIQELETAVRLGLKDLIYVVANNSAYGMIKTAQQSVFKNRTIDVDLPEFDYGRCAEIFGCYGESVSDPNEIKNALQRAKNSGKPAVIDVKIR
ncbi:MAG: thiamine pyrophosphate-binding protein [Candidatus Lokiarchaeota archaeon]|nr:thiamine pyrophosphate-binding protein [Candidatus Lokiarchaeota archaeon]